MKVTEFMTREVVSAHPDCPLDEAIEMFETHRFRHLPVADDGALVGMLSDRDVALATGWIRARHRATSQGTSPRRVEEVMTRELHTLPFEADASDAAELMLERRISALPVLREGRLSGLVTTTDLIRAACERDPSSDWRLRDGAVVEQWMSRDVKTIAPEVAMLDALDVCKLTGVRHLPVVDGRRLVGMISDRDLRFGLGQEMASDQVAQDQGRMEEPGMQVLGLMTPDVVTVAVDAPLEEAAGVLLERRFSALPVVEGRELVGLLTQTDLLRSCC